MADVIGGIVAELSATDNLSGPFAKARQAMDSLEAEMRRLKQEERDGILAHADYTAKVALLTAEQNRLTAAMTAAAPRVNALDSAMRQGGSGGVRDLGRGVLLVSQGVEDLQYGFAAIVNNIPNTLMAFGGGAGLAGAVSLAAVGINVLYNNFGKLQEAFGQSKTLTEAEQMKELGKQTKLTADEALRLSNFTRRESTGKAQDVRRPKAEGEITKAVAEAIGDLGSVGLKAQITRKILAGNAPITEAEIRDESGKLVGAPIGGRLGRKSEAQVLKEAEEKAIAAIRKRREDNATAAAAQLLRDAESGPGALGEAARKKLGEMLPGSSGAIFREQTPEGIAKREAEDRFESEGVRAAQKDAKLKKDRNDTIGIEAQHDAEEKAMAQARVIERIREENRQEQMSIEEGARFGADAAKAAKDEKKRVEKGMAENVRDFLKDDADLARLTERGSDLDWRLRLLMNPDKVGKSMGLDAFEASIKATTGLSEEAKRLHLIWEINKDIKENTKNIRALVRVPR